MNNPNKPKSTSEKLADMLGEEKDSADLSNLFEDEEEALLGVDSSRNQDFSPTQVKQLREELKVAENTAKDNWDKVLRVQAEMQNLQRRAERDVSNAHKYALEKFVVDLLPVLDSFERALSIDASDDPITQSMHEGMLLTMKMLSDTMSKYNVKELNPVGEKFNPEFHEAMAMQENTGKPAGTVIAVLQKGYTLNDRLVRPAMVAVAK